MEEETRHSPCRVPDQMEGKRCEGPAVTAPHPGRPAPWTRSYTKLPDASTNRGGSGTSFPRRRTDHPRSNFLSRLFLEKHVPSQGTGSTAPTQSSAGFSRPNRPSRSSPTVSAGLDAAELRFCHKLLEAVCISSRLSQEITSVLRLSDRS